jgi:microfibrillar-associated protein 1
MTSKINLAKKKLIKKEEPKNSNGLPIIFRTGQKPQWVEDSDDDIFSNSQSDDEIKKENLIYSTGKLEKQSKEESDIDNFVKSIKENLAQPSRKIYKSEIIQDEVAINNKLDNKNLLLPNNEEDEYINRKDIKKRLILIDQEKKKYIDKNNEDEDELLDLIGGNGSDNSEAGKIDNDGSNVIQNEFNDNLSSDKSEEYESNEDDVLMRPVFVSKQQRVTINEDQIKEIEEREISEQQEKIKELKRKQTKEILKKYQEEEENKKNETNENPNDEDEIEMPDDTDNPDDLDEYEKWKIRELRRIKIQFEEDEKKLKEKLEIERRRNLTNDQREAENLRLGSDDTLKPFKSKIMFLQKYYHKGAFFQNDSKQDLDHIYNRDTNLPTWQDKIDRSAMPKILQKRRGTENKKGQTKYTHLTAEDTTCFDRNFMVPENITNKFMSSSGGYKAKNEFELTNKKRKNY